MLLAMSALLEMIEQPITFNPDQEIIFNKFTGSGLELYRTNRIVALHGGTIRVKSALGKGTTISICLTVTS